jgi:hypothetical protein
LFMSNTRILLRSLHDPCGQYPSNCRMGGWADP